MARKNRNARRPKQTTPYDPLAPLTPEQINAQAQKYARTAIDPILASIGRSQADSAANITGYTEAMNRALAPIAGQIGDAFQTAGNATAGFGQGFADGLKMLGSQAPTANGAAQGDIATALGNLLAGGAANSVRGLGMQGAADATFAAQYPIFATGRGSQMLEKSIQGYNAQRKDVQDKVPALVQDYLTQLQDNEMKKRAQRLYEQQFRLEKDKFTESQRQFDVQTDLQREGMRLDWAQLDQNESQFVRDLRFRKEQAYSQAQANGNEARAEAIDNQMSALQDMGVEAAKIVSAARNGETVEQGREVIGYELEDRVDENGETIYRGEIDGQIVEGTPSQYPGIQYSGGPLRDKVPKYRYFNVKKPKSARYSDVFSQLRSLFMGTKRRYKLDDKTYLAFLYEAMRAGGYTESPGQSWLGW